MLEQTLRASCNSNKEKGTHNRVANIMTSLVEKTGLSYSTFMRERRELNGVSWWIVLPTYTHFLFVYVYA